MRNKIILSVFLLMVTLAVFSQTVHNDFINFDDPGYVTANPVVKWGITWTGVAWAFTATAMSNWHPLTWLSHMLDVQLFGLNPAGHHLMSVGLHALCALLLFLLLARITGAMWRSFFMAALFAIHPLHVESVAWVAERKDVLSCLFWLLTIFAYSRYVKSPGHKWYFLALLCFILGLMSKPMVVTLPLALLLLDYWPFHRFAGSNGQARGEGQTRGSAPTKSFIVLLKEKVPFFLLSALSAVITIYGQHKGGAMATLVKVPVELRLENALISYVKYILLMFFPHDLAMLYPFPKSVPLWQAIGAGLLLMVISLAVVRYRKNFPYLVTGWFWYLVTLLPVIGLVQVGGQALADRYTYIPLTGLFIICCWLLPDLIQGWRHREAALGAAAGIAVSVLAAVTWHQLGYWKDSITLYRHTSAVTTDNYLIYNNYGIALDERGDKAGAFRMFQEVLRIYPRSATAYNNIGTLYEGWGDYVDAINYYSRALEITPDYALAHAGLGKSLAGLGRADEAILEYEKALKIDPSLYDTHLNLAILLMKMGRFDEAGSHYDMALHLDRYSAKAPINMGVELAREGRLEEAAGYFTNAVNIDPGSVEAHFNRGVALARLGRTDEAAAEFTRVLELEPGSVSARSWLEKLRQGK